MVALTSRSKSAAIGPGERRPRAPRRAPAPSPRCGSRARPRRRRCAAPRSRARAEPPAPSTSARLPVQRLRRAPSMIPTASVFSAAIRRADEAERVGGADLARRRRRPRSASASAASLCGTVTLTPAKPSSGSERDQLGEAARARPRSPRRTTSRRARARPARRSASPASASARPGSRGRRGGAWCGDARRGRLRTARSALGRRAALLLRAPPGSRPRPRRTPPRSRRRRARRRSRA